MPARAGTRQWWAKLPTERLLDVRVCDLNVTIAETRLEEMVDRVRSDLSRKGLRFRPHFWLSDEWFCPKGVPGVAVPFYLAHPRLVQLERSQMLDVEGANKSECLKLLRHEVGHAIQNAYQLHRRRRWRELFGSSTKPYPNAYRPDPRTKAYVQHIDDWYAQCHPDEDFAETFAVWLTPRSSWRTRYADWSAIKKLEYVDELMADIADQPPRVSTRARPDNVGQLRHTLRDYYRDKQAKQGVGFSDLYDQDLVRLFDAPRDNGNETNGVAGEMASAFLRRNRKVVRTMISRWTGEYQYTLDEVLGEMIGRCRELKLRAIRPERELLLDFCIMLAVHTAHHVFLRREWRTV